MLNYFHFNSQNTTQIALIIFLNSLKNKILGNIFLILGTSTCTIIYYILVKENNTFIKHLLLMLCYGPFNSIIQVNMQTL